MFPQQDPNRSFMPAYAAEVKLNAVSPLRLSEEVIPVVDKGLKQDNIFRHSVLEGRQRVQARPMPEPMITQEKATAFGRLGSLPKGAHQVELVNPYRPEAKCAAPELDKAPHTNSIIEKIARADAISARQKLDEIRKKVGEAVPPAPVPTPASAEPSPLEGIPETVLKAGADMRAYIQELLQNETKLKAATEENRVLIRMIARLQAENDALRVK